MQFSVHEQFQVLRWIVNQIEERQLLQRYSSLHREIASMINHAQWPDGNKKTIDRSREELLATLMETIPPDDWTPAQTAFLLSLDSDRVLGDLAPITIKDAFERSHGATNELIQYIERRRIQTSRLLELVKLFLKGLAPFTSSFDTAGYPLRLSAPWAHSLENLAQIAKDWAWIFGVLARVVGTPDDKLEVVEVRRGSLVLDIINTTANVFVAVSAVVAIVFQYRDKKDSARQASAHFDKNPDLKALIDKAIEDDIASAKKELFESVWSIANPSASENQNELRSQLEDVALRVDKFIEAGGSIEAPSLGAPEDAAAARNVLAETNQKQLAQLTTKKLKAGEE